MKAIHWLTETLRLGSRGCNAFEEFGVLVGYAYMGILIIMILGFIWPTPIETIATTVLWVLIGVTNLNFVIIPLWRGIKSRKVGMLSDKVKRIG